MNNLESLVERGILKFAKLPDYNPSHLDFPSYTIPLIEHDYPAKTPVMWNSVYEKFEMQTRNIMMVAKPEDISQIFDVLRYDSKYLGGGAGVGFKDASLLYLDSIEETAKQIGAINIQVKIFGNSLKGYNTDGEGYAQSLVDFFAKKNEDLINKKIVMLGSGGTANAIAFALVEHGADVVILNRTVQVAEALATKLNNFYGFSPKDYVRFGGENMIASEVINADVVLNVSTKGSSGPLEQYSALAPALTPVNSANIIVNNREGLKVLDSIPKTTLISDILLTKNPTPLMQSASMHGYQTLGGIPMVINQGVEAFWIIHHKEMEDKGVTRAQIKEIMTQAATQ